jgi:hypothetical protein
MRDDTIARLAAANPVPAGAVPGAAVPFRPQRRVIALAALAVAAVPAVAFGARVADLLGIANEGTAVSTTDVLPGESNLDQAMHDLGVGSTMQFLGTLNGVRFYATRNAGGHVCLAIERVAAQAEKGFGCDLNADGFPSARVQALSFPPARRLQGVAADGVAKVAYLDADGNVLDETPVTNNLFASDTLLPAGAAATIETFDAQGNVTSKHALR